MAVIARDRQFKLAFLDEVGDGSGNHNAVVDGSVTPVTFKRLMGPNENWEVHRLIVFIRDTLGFSAEDYGNITGPLTNGVHIDIHNADGTTKNQFNSAGVTVHSNADWSRVCFEVVDLGFGSGDNYLAARWEFSRAGEHIHLHPGESIHVVVNDDLTGLVEHTFCIQGVKLGYYGH